MGYSILQYHILEMGQEAVGELLLVFVSITF